MGVTQLRPRIAIAAIASLSVILAGPEVSAVPRRGAAPLPTGPSPVAFSIEAVPGSWQWRWSIRNVSGAPVEVAADHRLVWIEVPPPPIDPSVPRWRRRRAKPVRCVFEARPSNAEAAVRTELRPNERYSELVDLRDVCRLRVPAAMAPGSLVVAHYGFEPFLTEGRGRPSITRWVSRTITPDIVTHPVNDLHATAPVPAGEQSTPEVAASPLGAEVAGVPTQAATAPGLRVSVALRNASSRPLWSMFRPTFFTFEVASPSGRQISCQVLFREVTPFREFFVRLGAEGRRAARLALADFCPLNTFDEAGIYRVRAVFRSSANGEPWLTGRVFTGRLVSSPFAVRVSRGDGRYRPLGLDVSG